MKPRYWDDARRRAGRVRPRARATDRAVPGHPPDAPRATRSPRSRGPSSASRSRSRRRRRSGNGWSQRPRASGEPVRLDAGRVRRTRRDDAAPRRPVGAQGEYLRDLARPFRRRGKLDPAQWPALDDEALIARAGRRQGHRALDRGDVPDLPRAARRHPSGRRHRPAEGDRAPLLRRQAADGRAMRELAARWQPYRSVATWYLWRSLDPIPVEY